MRIIIGTYCSELHKMVYLQNRRFLHEDSELRLDKNNFPLKAVEVRRAPEKRKYEAMNDIHKAYGSIKHK